MVVASLAVIGFVVLAVMTLTAVGSWQRGNGFLLATLAGFCFPITWTVWFLRDEHPHQRVGA